MPLVRTIARSLLAAPFVIGGASQIQNSEKTANRAAPVVRKIADSTGLPNDPELLVKANGAAMIAGGAGLATGVLRKPSALLLAALTVPTTAAGHPFWEETDPQQRKLQQIQFAKNAGLLGGLVLALVDTEGKPGMLFRAKLAKEGVERTARRSRREARHAARAAARETKLMLAEAKAAIT